MKNKTLFALILVAIGGRAQGQSTFQKYYYGAGTYTLDLYEQPSGNLVAGMAYESGISLMDAEGHMLHTHSYDIVPFLVLQSLKQEQENEYVFTGAYGIPNVEINPVIGKMDSLGNVISASYYALTNPGTSKIAGGDIVFTNDGGVVVTNRPSLAVRSFILKIDSLGEVVWCKDFGSGGSFEFVKELPGGDLLVGMTMVPGGAAVGRMDSGGNFIWLKSYIRPEGVMRDCEVESDSSFTVIGYTAGDYFSSGSKLFMMRLNGLGDVQWCKGYEGPSGWYTLRARLDRTMDGKYVTLGCIQGQGGGKAFLMKTDLNGDTLWTRAAGVTSNHYEVYNLLAHSDGGFLFNGQGWFLGAFLFKADSLGHLPCAQHNQWYPVQVQDLFPTDSSFTLTSIDGAVRNPAIITDTVYDPVVEVEGCTITSVINPMRPNKFRIRPNPTTGRFAVEFADPLMADSYYSIYDTMGRLLYQRPLHPGAIVEEIDLSRFGKGTYAIKLTDKDGVRLERVVLE